MARGSDENGICARYQGDYMSDIYGISMCPFYTWPFRCRRSILGADGGYQGLLTFQIALLSYTRSEVYQPQFESTAHGSLPSELPCHLPLNTKCASSVFPRS